MRPPTQAELAALAEVRYPAELLPAIARSIHGRFAADCNTMSRNDAWQHAQRAASEIATINYMDMKWANNEFAGLFDMSDPRERQMHAKNRRAAAARIESTLLAYRCVGRDAGQQYSSHFGTWWRHQRIDAGRRFAEKAKLIDPATGQEAAQAKIPTPDEIQARRMAEATAIAYGMRHFFEARGRQAVFITLTAPPCYHSNPSHGHRSYCRELTPDEAHKWLSSRWRAYGRNASRALGATPGGIRVVEAHQDGCTHWHMLIWIDPADRATLEHLLVSAFCQDIGPGDCNAISRRVTVMDEEQQQGSLVSYCFKYLQKTTTGLDANSVRVQATRALFGMRGIQWIGAELKGAMTLWRELRRIAEGSEEQDRLIQHESCAALARQAAISGDFGLFLEYHVAKSTQQAADPLSVDEAPESLIGLRPVYQRTATGNKRLIGLGGHGIFVQTRRQIPFEIQYEQNPATNCRADGFKEGDAAVIHNDPREDQKHSQPDKTLAAHPSTSIKIVFQLSDSPPTASPELPIEPNYSRFSALHRPI